MKFKHETVDGDVGKPSSRSIPAAGGNVRVVSKGVDTMKQFIGIARPPIQREEDAGFGVRRIVRCESVC
jgi:hypothetical protein